MTVEKERLVNELEERVRTEVINRLERFEFERGGSESILAGYSWEYVSYTRGEEKTLFSLYINKRTEVSDIQCGGVKISKSLGQLLRDRLLERKERKAYEAEIRHIQSLILKFGP